MPDEPDSRVLPERSIVRGRFAPSPTGPLHFGSLVAALASHLDARSRGGAWHVRMEDLDPPREVAGAADAILRALEAHGFEWDGPVVYQSRRHDLYAAALARLERAGHVYACACSRREIADSAVRGIEGPTYPGTCRNGIPPGRMPRAWRLRVHDARIAFEDEIHGPQCQDVAREIGDFILRRGDGLFAYQLAVVIDDAELGITRIVRGADLLDSTQRQIHLQRLLALPAPAYAHVPIAVNAADEKLSKQSRAIPLDPSAAGAALIAALRFLDQSPPLELQHASPRQILDWARAHWRLGRIAHERRRAAPRAFA